MTRSWVAFEIPISGDFKGQITPISKYADNPFGMLSILTPFIWHDKQLIYRLTIGINTDFHPHHHAIDVHVYKCMIPPSPHPVSSAGDVHVYEYMYTVDFLIYASTDLNIWQC